MGAVSIPLSSLRARQAATARRARFLLFLLLTTFRRCTSPCAKSTHAHVQKHTDNQF